MQSVCPANRIAEPFRRSAHRRRNTDDRHVLEILPATNRSRTSRNLHAGLHLDGCNAGREEALALIATSKSETVAKAVDPELERRRQLAEVEILEAEGRIKKALADTRGFYAQRRKPTAVP
jgi:hypothetical protein